MSTKVEKLKNQLELLKSVEATAKRGVKQNLDLLKKTQKTKKKLKKKLEKLEGKK